MFVGEVFLTALFSGSGSAVFLILPRTALLYSSTIKKTPHRPTGQCGGGNSSNGVLSFDRCHSYQVNS